jgi:hypothetical protein
MRRAALLIANALAWASLVFQPALAAAPAKPPVDMTGLWIGFRDPASPYRNTRPPSPVPFTPEGEKMSKFWELPENNLGQRCLPGGGPIGVTGGSSYFPLEVIQKDKQVTFIQEYQNQVRRVYLDGRGHPKDLDPMWYGHSVGHWEGDTLVVDTVRVKQGTINGSNATVNVLETDKDPRLPFSPAMHLVERFRMLEGGKFLENTMTIEDPVMYTKPLTFKKYWKRADDLQMYEYICAENLRPEDEGAPAAAK